MAVWPCDAQFQFVKASLDSRPGTYSWRKASLSKELSRSASELRREKVTGNWVGWLQITFSTSLPAHRARGFVMVPESHKRGKGIFETGKDFAPGAAQKPLDDTPQRIFFFLLAEVSLLRPLANDLRRRRM